MAAPLGEQAQPHLDLPKSQRQGVVCWVLVAGLPVYIVCDLLGLRFAAQVFQAWLATTLPYGVSFYVNERGNVRTRWFLKALVATLPIHLGYLVGVFWSDRVLAEIMTKALAFVPILAVGAAIESLFFFDRTIRWFKAHEAGSPN